MMPNRAAGIVYVNQVAVDEPVGQGARERGFIGALLKQTRVPVRVVSAYRMEPVFCDPRVHEIQFVKRGISDYLFHQLQLTIALFRLTRRNRSVVFIRFSPSMIAPALFGLVRSVPVVVRSGPTADMFEGRRTPLPIRWLLRASCRALFRRARAVIAVTETTRATLIGEHDLDPNRVFVIPNGVDPAMFSVEVENHDRDVVGYLGSLYPEQGVDQLIEVLPRLRTLHPNAELHILGSGSSLPDLRRRADELGVGPFVKFLGSVSHGEVANRISQFKVAAAPFTAGAYEGRGSSAMKIIEYLASGRPIVTSRHGDHEFIAENGVGILYEPDDQEELFKALSAALSLPDRERRLMSVRGRALAARLYAWEVIVERTLDVCLPK